MRPHVVSLLLLVVVIAVRGLGIVRHPITPFSGATRDDGDWIPAYQRSVPSFAFGGGGYKRFVQSIKAYLEAERSLSRVQNGRKLVGEQAAGNGELIPKVNGRTGEGSSNFSNSPAADDLGMNAADLEDENNGLENPAGFPKLVLPSSGGKKPTGRGGSGLLKQEHLLLRWNPDVVPRDELFNVWVPSPSGFRTDTSVQLTPRFSPRIG
ncbi:hypothetical protein BV898_01222 [Hypsibius exemplaris]|uniref:Uncharacterized protein n=1 Tax=Hypsibius exemplaris TaxID=2072580 RepID=A0A1W0XC24_HYPEX|nr:hypothetical protein BV898_01222 [Hypsibius exemplaris]